MMESWCVSIMLPGPSGGTCRMKRDGDVRVILYRGKNQVVPGIMTDLVTEIAHHRLVESPRPNHVGDKQIHVVDKPRHRGELLVAAACLGEGETLAKLTLTRKLQRPFRVRALVFRWSATPR